jgi:hypothetical protein
MLGTILAALVALVVVLAVGFILAINLNTPKGGSS